MTTNARISKVASGWAARGNGWAVHGKTKQQAIRRFEERRAFRDGLEKRPYWYANPDNPDLDLNQIVRFDER